MVLDFYLGHKYQRQRYKLSQEGYSYPQAGNPSYSMPPMGTGYNAAPLPNHQYQNLPMGYGYSHPHGTTLPHAHNQGYAHQHQNQHNGMTTYSAATMGFGGNHGSPVGQGYGPSYNSGTEKYSNVYSAYKGIDD